MIGMALKPTTQVFTMREGVSQQIPFDASSTGAGFETVRMNTNLDTLNREVLLIQEVDFDLLGISYWAGVQSRINASVDENVQWLNSALDIILTEVDPAVDPNALQLDSPHFIASRSIQTVAGLWGQSTENPDTASYTSQAGKNHALFTTASDSLYLTFAYGFNGNNSATMSGANPTVRGLSRIMCQRAKADADTYAAILTGLYA